MNEQLYYIKKNGAYFRGEAKGYTYDMRFAGVFTRTTMGRYWDDEALDKIEVDVDMHNLFITNRIEDLTKQIIK